MHLLKKLKKRIYEILVWALLWVVVYFLPAEDDENRQRIALLVLFMFAVPSYAHFFIFDRLFIARKYFLYALAFIALVMGFALFEYYVLEHYGLVSTSWLNRISNVVIIIAVSMGVRYARRGILQQYNQQELKAKNLEFELNMLKTQVHPHFLYNTLNNIYALSLDSPQETSEMILKLSGIMRYLTEKMTEKKVPVREEVKFIEDYLDLERLRLNDRTRIDLIVELQSDDAKVPPTVLLPFVENAIKHGASNRFDSHIKIHLTQKGRELHLQVENPVIENKQKVSTLTGVSNIRRRLEILYPDRHQLKNAEQDGIYHTELKLTL
jgi:hypothetical protein